MLNTNGQFYLGRLTGENKPLLYDPADLTTHAVVVGMTGSGKTGLCIDLLEEAALQGIPALMIDPKGDITNTLLHFPELLPADFQPWIDPDKARRSGQSVEQAASETAAAWKQGLADWGMGSERLRALKNAAQFAVYTPGSDAGIPVSILASLRAPEIPWEANRELLREKISGTVTAILGLVGLTDIDPVRSREHILLSNIFETAWSQGKNLNLGEFILQTQNPPFPKLGVFDIDTFFPQKERFALAMTLNNILAAPSFQAWIEGQPLDIPSLLYTPEGKPRHSVFYIAHLSDTERMFFVALLYAAVETWMRAQSGTSGLRAIVYFDEIFGYMPPVANPPSKPIMLRMLKQGRAFGVGQVLVTQNPADLDYKALSNAGSWFIGKLQTENDKNRLLDGLQGAAPGLDRKHYDKLISTLDKRVFLLHNIHAPSPPAPLLKGEGGTFQTRWAMNYLAGPLTRNQIGDLNQLADVRPPRSVETSEVSRANQPDAQTLAGVVSAPEAATHPRAESGSSTRPGAPTGIEEVFLPHNLTLSQAAKACGKTLPNEAKSLGLLYRPALIAQASVRFMQRKYNLDHEIRRAALATQPDRRGTARWDEWLISPLDKAQLDREPAPGARFAAIEAPLSDGKLVRALQSDFGDWMYHNSEAAVRANESLGIFAGPGISQAEFRRQCAEAARQKRDEEIKKVEDSFDKKLNTIQDRLKREERELSQDEAELRDRRMEEYGTHFENALSLLSSRRRRLSTSLTKRRLTEQAKSDVEESLAAIEEYERQITALQGEQENATQEINTKWGDLANTLTEISVRPYKKDILLEHFGIAWMPYHIVEVGGQTLELPGFGKD